MKSSDEKKGVPRELRCFCGSLMARIVEDHVELKCKRCKQIHLVPLQHSAAPVGKPRRTTKSPHMETEKGQSH